MKHSDIVKKFSEGVTKAKGSRMFIDGNILYSYGYHFPIAIRLNSPQGFRYIFNKKGYSTSTSRHKNYFKREVGESCIMMETANIEDFGDVKEVSELKEILKTIDKNIKIIKEKGFDEGHLLKNKVSGKVVEIKHIHPFYGWVTCEGLKDDWSNINDFEIAKKEMIVKNL